MSKIEDTELTTENAAWTLQYLLENFSKSYRNIQKLADKKLADPELSETDRTYWSSTQSTLSILETAGVHDIDRMERLAKQIHKAIREENRFE